MNPIENVYDPVIAGTLLAGAGATYDGELFMRCWAANLGCTQMETIRDAATDTLVFVAANETEVFVCFRGTQDLRNWITDLDCRRVAMDLQTCQAEAVEALAGVEVHEGFYRALLSVWGELGCVLERMAPGKRDIFFIGHSLGGALAMLACAWWEHDIFHGSTEVRPTGWVYTFGQPRVGNRAWMKWYDAMLRRRSFRVVHAEDIVARVPWLLGMFRHAGIECFYDALGQVHQDWPWWKKAPSDVFGTWAEWRRAGRIALIADHSWTTYEPLLGRNAPFVNPANP